MSEAREWTATFEAGDVIYDYVDEGAALVVDEDAGEVSTFAGYEEWQDVDRELRSLARRQSAIDAELMVSLREAERVRLWRHVGCASLMEYLERVFGYSPRVAQERMRTARRLVLLPELADALARNEVPFSAVREVSRIATPKTERIWCTAVQGKSLREVEEMVSGLAEGDLPTSRKKPELQTATYALKEITPATRALARQLRDLLDGERGERMDDEAFLAAMVQRALEATLSESEAPSVGAKFQVVQYHCENCKQAKQLGGGVTFDIDPAEAQRALCDAEHVPGDAPGKAVTDIAPKVRRFVTLRDHKRCRVPGCRSRRSLEIHHIVHRENGGSHQPENLILLCEGHHAAHHRGTLLISGTAPDNVQFKRVRVASSHAGSAHVGAGIDPRYKETAARTLAVDALERLGWRQPVAGRAVDAAIADLRADAPIDELIRSALQRCREYS